MSSGSFAKVISTLFTYKSYIHSRIYVCIYKLYLALYTLQG